jgi:hypothetical protein
MRLSEEFKRFVTGQKTENDLERQKEGLQQYKNIFSYYRFSRAMLIKQYEDGVVGNTQKNNEHEDGH